MQDKSNVWLSTAVMMSERAAFLRRMYAVRLVLNVFRLTYAQNAVWNNKIINTDFKKELF